MDKITNMYNQYYDKAMIWYEGLTFLEQMGVLFVLFIGGFAIVAYFLIRRAAGS
jgi:hypothetical protein